MLKKNESGPSRRKTRFTNGHAEVSGFPECKFRPETLLNSSYYFWLIEEINDGFDYIGWIGDADAFIDRFGMIPEEVRLVTPDAFGMTALPPPKQLVSLPNWLVCLMLDEGRLPLKTLTTAAD